jgi:hypothetical protein
MGRINVTVSEDNKTARIMVGNLLGVHRDLSIDLSDAGSIVSGLTDAMGAGDQAVQAQLAQLAQRVEVLEKLANGKAVGTAS